MQDGEEWALAIREDLPARRTRRHGKPPVYFDNACTTLVPEPVVRAMDEYYAGFPGCGGARSRHWFAAEVTGRIEGDPEKGTGRHQHRRDDDGLHRPGGDQRRPQCRWGQGLSPAGHAGKGQGGAENEEVDTSDRPAFYRRAGRSCSF
jgi:hypothetical protein